MSVQTDVESKKEQIGTLFDWVGALEGGFGGWVVPQGCPPQKVDMPSKKTPAKNNQKPRDGLYPAVPSLPVHRQV
jgi:hypothetical protein